jgi:hypothetical protein
MDIAQSERDIREATKLLFNEAIPALARELDDVDVSDLLQSVTEYEVSAQPLTHTRHTRHTRHTQRALI